MKPDKIIFTCSEQFSPFWNLQSQIWKTKMGIEPVLLLFGKKENTNVSEEFGKVHEMETDSSVPAILQVTVSKFICPLFVGTPPLGFITAGLKAMLLKLY